MFWVLKEKAGIWKKKKNVVGEDSEEKAGFWERLRMGTSGVLLGRDDSALRTVLVSMCLWCYECA